MKAKDVLQFQLQGSFNLLDGLSQSITDREWVARTIPGLSQPGFVVWHGARIIDWGVHCAIQGVPEIASRPEQLGLRATEMAYGAGINDQEADQIAATVSRTTVAAYLVALRPAVLGWFESLTDADLEAIPDFEAHQRANARYLTAPVWAEVEGLKRVPTWQILARPCISHIRVHAGEVETLLRGIRAEVPA